MDLISLIYLFTIHLGWYLWLRSIWFRDYGRCLLALLLGEGLVHVGDDEVAPLDPEDHVVARPLDEVLAVVVVHPEDLAPVDLDDVVLRPQAGVVRDGAVVDLGKRKESVVLINISEKFRCSLELDA